MSQIAFVTWNGGGNLGRALAFARELRRRGHRGVGHTISSFCCLSAVASVASEYASVFAQPRAADPEPMGSKPMSSCLSSGNKPQKPRPGSISAGKTATARPERARRERARQDSNPRPAA